MRGQAARTAESNTEAIESATKDLAKLAVEGSAEDRETSGARLIALAAGPDYTAPMSLRVVVSTLLAIIVSLAGRITKLLSRSLETGAFVRVVELGTRDRRIEVSFGAQTTRYHAIAEDLEPRSLAPGDVVAVLADGAVYRRTGLRPHVLDVATVDTVRGDGSVIAAPTEGGGPRFELARATSCPEPAAPGDTVSYAYGFYYGIERRELPAHLTAFERRPTALRSLAEVVGGQPAIRRVEEVLAAVCSGARTSGVGILFAGAVGQGKSLAARHVADYCLHLVQSGPGPFKDVSVFACAGPEILDKWVGSSGRNMAGLFVAARRRTDEGHVSIVVIDEVESVLSSRSAAFFESHGERLACIDAFLAHAQLEESPGLVVLLITNIPERLDQAVLSRVGEKAFFSPFTGEGMVEAVLLLLQKRSFDARQAMGVARLLVSRVYSEEPDAILGKIHFADGRAPMPLGMPLVVNGRMLRQIIEQTEPRADEPPWLAADRLWIGLTQRVVDERRLLGPANVTELLGISLQEGVRVSRIEWHSAPDPGIAVGLYPRGAAYRISEVTS